MPNQGAFPSRDAELNDYFQIAVGYLTNPANVTRLGISTAHVTALNAVYADWLSYYPSSKDANTRTKTITDQKEAAKKSLIDLLREVYDDIPQSKLSPADRNTLHLPERSAPTKTPIPSTRPVGKVDTSQRLQHTISFTDESTPTSRAKPDRVRGCQIWHYVSAEGEPSEVAEYRYLATDTASPYVATYDSADAGKKAYYMLRWENTRGECGPWSETVMATITA